MEPASTDCKSRQLSEVSCATAYSKMIFVQRQTTMVIASTIDDCRRAASVRIGGAEM
jgi:hypothetical protein